ncbi:nucleotide exchange factor GrpE [Paenibacillus aquistagni]|uniref:nucleotide exchange factor GrpE n=1 Tax=Paenibacillus aquistagni TaxID=1852522 RepID=UPI0023F7588C|nr:nucleotide exchange factor GrpE [Paenibacillus aquistagni]
MKPEQEQSQTNTAEQEKDMEQVEANASHDHMHESDSTPAAEEEILEQEANALNAELQQAKKESEENYQRLLRAQADFDNFRRRTQKEKEDLAKYASQKLIEEIVPVLDNFERAMATKPGTPEVKSFAKGMDMIFRQLQQVLEQEGLQAMNTVGEAFNPEFHQAIMQVESDEHEEGIVVEEVQRGYMLKDRVLRPAMVKVSG